MLFSVIYSADCPRTESIVQFRPPRARKLWDQTEGDDQYDYGYLEGDWKKGKHRKWCALLTKGQFNEFVEALGLVAEDVRTMGSIGTPGCGFGCAPAISFNDSGDVRAILNAYVTPIPETKKQDWTEQDWERVRTAVIKLYGHRPKIGRFAA